MAVQTYPEPKVKPVKFSNNSDQENHRKDFVLQALQRHFRGDMQLVYQHLPEFLESPALKALLGKLTDLEKEVFEVWEMEGYGKVAGETETEVSQTVESPDSEPISETEASYPRKVILANGKVQQGYRFDLTGAFPELLANGAVSLKIEGHETAGLTLNAHAQTLSGTPTEAGHYRVTFQLLQPGVETEVITSDLHIIPDPRLLWKELEPEPGQDYAKPHTDAAMLSGKDKAMLGASRRGRSHAHTGAFREDDFAMDYLASDSTDGWYLTAVSDGAGSAKFSRRGSQLACRVALDHLKKVNWKAFEEELRPLAEAFRNSEAAEGNPAIATAAYPVLGKAALAAYEAILSEAEATEEEPSAFHATLLLTVAKKFDFGWWIGAWWAGDGAIGLYRVGESVKILGKPDGGEFAGQTRFLTSKEVWESEEAVMNRIAFDLVDDYTCLALMSDGVSDPMFQTDYNMGQLEKWDALWNQWNESVDFSRGNPNAAEQLLEWLNFWSTGDHDDRTIALIV